MKEITCIHQVYNPDKCPLLKSIKCEDCLYNANSDVFKFSSVYIDDQAQLLINQQMDKDYEEANRKGK